MYKKVDMKQEILVIGQLVSIRKTKNARIEVDFSWMRVTITTSLWHIPGIFFSVTSRCHRHIVIICETKCINK